MAWNGFKLSEGFPSIQKDFPNPMTLEHGYTVFVDHFSDFIKISQISMDDTLPSPAGLFSECTFVATALRFAANELKKT